MMIPCSFSNPVESYSSYKKKFAHKYREKARKLFIGIDDSSLKDGDKKKLKNELTDLLKEKL